MAIIKRLKNNSGSTKFILSRDVDDQAYYNIPVNLWLQVNNDTDITDDIVAGDLIVNNGTDDLNVTDGLNWLSKFGTKNIEVDDQGRQIVRRATSIKGWHYSAIMAEIKTSTTATYNKDYLGNDLNEVSIVMYDVNDAVTTVGADCVKTVVTIAPDYDYEIIEGDVYHTVRPTENVRLWTLAGIPQLGPNYVKTFVNGLNLRFMSPDDHIESDGRSSKFMLKTIPGVPYNGNQFQFIFKHSAGFEHEVMVLLELYRD